MCNVNICWSNWKTKTAYMCDSCAKVIRLDILFFQQDFYSYSTMKKIYLYILFALYQYEGNIALIWRLYYELAIHIFSTCACILVYITFWKGNSCHWLLPINFAYKDREIKTQQNTFFPNAHNFLAVFNICS